MDRDSSYIRFDRIKLFRNSIHNKIQINQLLNNLIGLIELNYSGIGIGLLKKKKKIGR